MLPYLILSYISVSYVIVLYISAREAENFKIKRDDPKVIKHRMEMLCKIMLLNLFVLPFLQTTFAKVSPSFGDAFLNLGLIPGHYIAGHWDIKQYLKDILKVILLINLLYIGPVLDGLLYYVFTNGKTLKSDIIELFGNIWGVRNYIFAPITEELFYTSMLLTTYLSFYSLNELSLDKLLWETSLFFGLAHAHHAYESFHEGVYSKLNILMSTLFQVLYTTLFGALTNYVFIATGGNLWACIFLHMFCNIMGFPGKSTFIFHFTIMENNNNNNAALQRLLRLWETSYLGLLVLGIIVFIKNFKFLIGTDLYGISF
ncbi:hypothetical protein KAFR_0B03870 [Kazachstania africana CBS 2517]|uniref:intramembrane prenyl-peptidase Rce1 n=1 Tax=Kazachstania africana (strain ATCC 22294 / BCRC 22015 / CBS 2517 / CECT 1963 / NBRC 1671 / NRRL Y-8276) TaxID=1071382 RepID=H2AQN3_KAZAF|nr:hypothetical protein KAFR_0B03870 [Kazachstania africana CBS 2517]CCF56683.1 hypothetical protein KAFR_0B03870 [Kazachstania africana CBS 2517]